MKNKDPKLDYQVVHPRPQTECGQQGTNCIIHSQCIWSNIIIARRLELNYIKCLFILQHNWCQVIIWTNEWIIIKWTNRKKILNIVWLNVQVINHRPWCPSVSSIPLLPHSSCSSTPLCWGFPSSGLIDTDSQSNYSYLKGPHFWLTAAEWVESVVWQCCGPACQGEGLGWLANCTISTGSLLLFFSYIANKKNVLDTIMSLFIKLVHIILIHFDAIFPLYLWSVHMIISSHLLQYVIDILMSGKKLK